MSKTALITPKAHFHWRASCLFSAWINTRTLSANTTSLFGPRPPRLPLLSRIPPPQVVRDRAASPFHPLQHLSRLIPAALTAVYSSGQEVRQGERWAGSDGSCGSVKDRLAGSRGGLGCRQNEETEEGGPHWRGCTSGRRSGDVTVCCLSAGWCFCTFTRPLWMDGWAEWNQGRLPVCSTSGTRLPFIPLRLEISLWNEKWFCRSTS